MVPTEAVRTYICKLIEAPDFMRTVQDVYVVTFWDRQGGKGLTLDVRPYDRKWAIYVRQQDRVDTFGLPSYVEMMIRAKAFMRGLQQMLQRDYWYGPNDKYLVWTGTVSYRGSIYRAGIAALHAHEAQALLYLKRRTFTMLWKECVDNPDVIETVLREPQKIWIQDQKVWTIADLVPVSIREET